MSDTAGWTRIAELEAEVKRLRDRVDKLENPVDPWASCERLLPFGTRANPTNEPWIQPGTIRLPVLR